MVGMKGLALAGLMGLWITSATLWACLLVDITLPGPQFEVREVMLYAALGMAISFALLLIGSYRQGRF